MAESSSAEKTPKASKLDQALMGKLDSLAEAIKGSCGVAVMLEFQSHLRDVR
eukprot:m.77018 g.77018  ORF g.77018 m.77018 type:complete len:52 (-) comp14448_c0_seq1:70-225(-)